MDAERILLADGEGLEAELLAWGASLAALRVPDRAGRLADVVLGFDEAERYRGPHPCFGCIVGRYANRIGGARYRLDGREVRLLANEGRHHLHGGPEGFSRRAWEVERLGASPARAVRFRLLSPDGDQGHPGSLAVEVTYTLPGRGELRVEARATSDAPTMVSLTQHAYFHLGGGRGDVLDHELWIAADAVLCVDAEGIPTGEVADVAGTAFDFRAAAPLGARIARVPGGYDHCYRLRGEPGRLRPAARLRDPASGRRLELRTTEPGLQLYTANGLDGIRGKGGARYGRHAGVCLEPQRLPDAPNHAHFPSARLDPGQVYAWRSVYRFAAD